MKPVSLVALLLAAGLWTLHAVAAAGPDTPARDRLRAVADPQDTPYPGVIELQVDASDLQRRVVRVRQRLPAAAGPLTLLYPRWLPGTHGPSGDVNFLAGLKISDAAGQPVPWTRDPLDPFAFHLEVPLGGTTLDLEFQHLSPLGERSGRVAISHSILGLQWETVVVYPAGHYTRRIAVRPSLRLPPGWQQAAALRAPDGSAPQPDGEGWVRYGEVNLETLVDAPVFAGRHMKRVPLDAPGRARPVMLNIVADEPEQLNASETQLAAHRQLVRQADLLFGARHFGHYDFLLALSDSFGRIGLEHHQSSENAVKPGYFKDWDKSIESRDLLPHEYVHSWNGKFRRPAELWTPTYNVPMRTSLLWVYEGQTQYWGHMLTVRSGLATVEQGRDALAQLAAVFDHRSGRRWRNLQDTTQDNLMSARRPKDWPDWQRMRDYYDEATLIWLDVDTLIRERSGGKRSLDDFAKRFFGVEDGRIEPLTYTFEDVVRTLNEVQPHDWAAFLRRRLDSNEPVAPLDGLARAGWKLVYDDKPSPFFKAEEGQAKVTNLLYSIGLLIREDGTLAEVAWEGPAFSAGVAPGMKLLAVNLRAYKPEVLQQAITAARGQDTAPIELLLQQGDRYHIARVEYRGGLRYPRLERIAGTPDRLGQILAPR
ncbi:peptidase M61 [Aquabacterium sp. A7-Y]|uniref:M61 family metallopeptidase n=1 Tax=Aquabacterium sp. A7-Y TaxID=1349605 RepID=UPI00223CEC95|nr:peptidase M61 [Aquabacterium sp. A7-Y]MCW7537406.1 peptidase M61 [Aquabacterium sp. A7-Y]